MLSDAIQGLLVPGLKAGMGVAAVYHRATTNLNITAIAQGGGEEQYGMKLGDSPDSTDYVIFTPEIGYCGFSVSVADLATLTPPVPQRGDKITIGAEVYDILSPQGLREWCYQDLPFKQLFLVHTKLS